MKRRGGKGGTTKSGREKILKGSLLHPSKINKKSQKGKEEEKAGL